MTEQNSGRTGQDSPEYPGKETMQPHIHADGGRGDLILARGAKLHASA